MINFFVIINFLFLLPLIVYGIVIKFINDKIFDKLRDSSKSWIYILSGIVGTPIHELSHLIVDKLFLHKITGLALYRPIKCRKDGVMGYVNTSYNPNSMYQTIGTFFGGIAPLIGGSISLILLMKFLLPEVFINFKIVNFDSMNFLEIFKQLVLNTTETIKSLFQNFESKGNLIIFLLLTFSITLHMTLSKEDVKSAFKGFVFFEIVSIIISILLYTYNLSFLTTGLFTGASYLITLLFLGLCFAIISYMFSVVIALIP